MDNKLPELYSIIKCAKCGYVCRKYRTWGDYGATDFTCKYSDQEFSFYYGQLHIDKPECMIITCSHCGYWWKEACLNEEEEE
jgi:DNA-directed RNA polymerase subunit M/transcription elongation factor TFIIS